MASAHKLALRSLQIGPTETSRRFQKKGHRNPPLAFESSFSDILSRDFTNGDKPPLSLPSLVCCGFVPVGRKAGRSTGHGRGELGEQEK